MDEKRKRYMNNGLTSAQVVRAREEHGSNALTRTKRRSFIKVYLSGFSDPIIRILLGAVAVNAVFTYKSFDLAETLGILAAVFIAVTVSAFSEYRSENAFERLRSREDPRCRAIRDGSTVLIPIDEVVTGDLLSLGAGETVPADGVVVKGELRVDQSAINGESREVLRRPDPAPLDRWDPNRINQVFRGARICSGEALVSVCRVGDRTLYGEVAREVQQESPDSPLKRRLGDLARWISRVGGVTAALIAAVTLFVSLKNAPAGYSAAYVYKCCLEALTVAVTILVVAVPEGLPMMITVVLSSNMKRMLRDNVLVKKAVGIETAGSMTMLFTDKTGTLTGGAMALTGVLGPDLAPPPPKSALMRELALSAALDSAARLSGGKAVGGTATDRAILEGSLSVIPEVLPRIKARLPFDSRAKYSAAWTADGTVYVKGAPDRLLPRVISACGAPFNADSFSEALRGLAARGNRLVLACRGEGGVPGREIPDDLVLLGVFVLRDPLRPEAPSAVDTIRRAGVKVVMVTGDSPDTAAAVAKECGIIRSRRENVVVTGDELDAMTDAELKSLLPRLKVVARAVPAHKSRLVRLARELGEVAGMTGDGVNDAAALRLADVGFAMGSGTQIARDAADVVITDDRFASVVKAVLYGRTVFKSIRKFIMFQLTMNLCAVGVSLIAPLLGVPQPITVLQMLWVNIIMDTLGGIAFAGESPMDRYMTEPPKRPDEPILRPAMIRRVLVAGLSTLAVCLAFLKSESVRAYYGYYSDPAPFLTAFFVTFIFAGVFNCFVMRSPRVNIFSGITKNHAFVPVMLFITAVQLALVYFGGSLVRTVPLTLPQLSAALAAAAIVLPVNIAALVFSRLNGEINTV